jgi:hypothetical protein
MNLGIWRQTRKPKTATEVKYDIKEDTGFYKLDLTTAQQ